VRARARARVHAGEWACTSVCLVGRARVTQSRGWGRRWLVSCWRARNTSRQPRLFQQLACAIESRGSERETEKRREREGRSVLTRGVASHPLFAVLFKKLASSLRERSRLRRFIARFRSRKQERRRELCSGDVRRFRFRRKLTWQDQEGSLF